MNYQIHHANQPVRVHQFKQAELTNLCHINAAVWAFKQSLTPDDSCTDDSTRIRGGVSAPYLGNHIAGISESQAEFVYTYLKDANRLHLLQLDMVCYMRPLLHSGL